MRSGRRGERAIIRVYAMITAGCDQTGYGFIDRHGDLHAKNKAGKVLLTSLAGAKPFHPPPSQPRHRSPGRDYSGERGRRGLKLPRGFRRVGEVSVEG